MWQLHALWVLYLLTMKTGVIGNFWVICSIIRNARPQTYGWVRQPSDCLRYYILILAFADFFVLCSLALRIVYIWDVTLTLGTWSCQSLYSVEQLSKMIAMFCLAHISIARYITIRKPLNSQIRRHFHQGFPTVTLFSFFLFLIPILLTVQAIDVDPDRWDCRINGDSAWGRLTGLLIGACFILLLMLVGVNYAQIVRLVHRKFSRREARQTVSYNSKRYGSPEPRYVREMTFSVARVALFHMICWLPFCFIAMAPTDSCSVALISIRAISRINEKHAWVSWILILANWLTYLNSALNWIFYALLNRDLRKLIRSNTKRRKHNAMTYHYSLLNSAKKYSRQRLNQSSSIDVQVENM